MNIQTTDRGLFHFDFPCWLQNNNLNDYLYQSVRLFFPLLWYIYLQTTGSNESYQASSYSFENIWKHFISSWSFFVFWKKRKYNFMYLYVMINKNNVDKLECHASLSFLHYGCSFFFYRYGSIGMDCYGRKETQTLITSYSKRFFFLYKK
jgi:hypothetical protein